MRKIFTLLTLCMLATAASAVQITFDPNVDKGNGSTTAGAYTVEKDGIKMVVSQGQINVYNDVMAYRIYKHQTATFTSEIGPITKIEVTTQFKNDTTWSAAGFQADGYVANMGDYHGTWNGSASPVVLTATNFQVRASEIIVTVGDAGLSAPIFSPGAGTYYQPIDVTIRCITEGAKVYYTMDGSTPTTSSTEYTTPISLSSDATIKAISALDGEVSDVVTASYVFTEAPAFTWCDMFDTPDNTTVTFSNPSVVLWQSGSTMYVKEKNSDCFGLVYGSLNKTYTIGNVIPAGFGGKKTTYNGMPELQNLTGFEDATETVEVNPEKINPTQVDESHWAHYVLLENVLVNTGNTTLTDVNGNSCPYFNNTFKAELPSDLTVRHDVYGIVAAYQKGGQGDIVWQILPISFDNDPGHIEIDTVDVECIKDVLNLSQNDKALFTTPLTAVYKYYANLYVQDYDGHFALVYGGIAADTLVNGDIINDAMVNWTTYQNNWQFIPTSETFVKSGTTTPVQPVTIDFIEDFTENHLHYFVKLPAVSITKGDKDRTYNMTDETGEAILYNRFNLENVPEDGSVHAVWGFVTIYNNQFEIYPISIDIDPVGPQYDRRDVNRDGEVNIADINAVITTILKNVDNFNGRADVNGDGETNIADVNDVIRYILFGE